MKQISVAKINELLMSLKAQRADLLEDKYHMLDHYDLDDTQDALEYTDLCNEIADVESAIDNFKPDKGYSYGTASDANNSIVTTVSKNKGQNGYFKLGNGLIIQWGVVTETGATREVVFPVDFTTTNYSVCINPTNSNSDQVYTINVNNKTNSGFTSFCGGNVSLWPFNWIAIGY